MPEQVCAVVRFRAPGFHHWPGATGERTYLGARHRHLFWVEVRLALLHDEREVEFHDLLDFAKQHFAGGELGARSCETMARELAQKIADQFPGRHLVVSVFEDGEVGASFTTN